DPDALTVTMTEHLTDAAVEGQAMVVEVRFVAEAVGRPRLAAAPSAG
ncbi:MAG: hypothetical protein ACI9ZH_000388, partial [Paracoccaceae bacterium]